MLRWSIFSAYSKLSARRLRRDFGDGVDYVEVRKIAPFLAATVPSETLENPIIKSGNRGISSAAVFAERCTTNVKARPGREDSVTNNCDCGYRISASRPCTEISRTAISNRPTA